MNDNLEQAMAEKARRLSLAAAKAEQQKRLTAMNPEQQEAIKRARQSKAIQDAQERMQAAAQKQHPNMPPMDSMGFPTPPQGGVSTNSQAVEDFKPKLEAAFGGSVQGASFGVQDEFRGLWAK